MPTSAHERPRRRLVGFARVAVPTGATVRARVRVRLAVLDVRVDGALVAEDRPVELVVAHHAADPGLVVEVAQEDIRG